MTNIEQAREPYEVVQASQGWTAQSWDVPDGAWLCVTFIGAKAEERARQYAHEKNRRQFVRGDP